jgi:hypothetical protein
LYEEINPDDENECTIDSCDKAYGLEYTDVDCEDYNACTYDWCDRSTGC